MRRVFSGRALQTRPGYPVVYTASSLSLAVLEVLLHLELDPDLLPDDYVSLKIDVPDGLARRRAPEVPRGSDVQAIGMEWLRAQDAPLLEVPSAIVPPEINLLINPRHPDAGTVQVLDRQPFGFDPRLARP